ncbi:MAG: carboxypeptidase-like regulatory domain-containing protein [Bacteroidales bacterium]|nr:carboxypeptidase-like regulatory domain-containing protein [Bacteroidales bacterium]
MFRLFFMAFAIMSILYPETQAQGVLSGLITDSSGNPVPYATVYIQELQQGTTANAMGNYEIKLPAGTYTVFFQSLGYNQDFRQIVIGESPVIRNVSLTIQYFQIPEVNVSSSGEDPAYAIIRKAVARAPFYLNAVEHYKAMVYLKGTAIIDKMPKMLTRAIEKDSDVNLQVGEKYLYESHNEIEFNAPDNYIHRLIAIQSNFPSEGDQISPMSYIQASFYEPVIIDVAVSPLAPNTFSYYDFSYEGASLQGQYVINKIKVIPRRKSQQVFSGTIYIIEDLWCIHSLDLTNENLIGKVRVRQLYTPVQNDFWMPVSHTFDIDFSMVGIKGRGMYGGSVKYSEIRTGVSVSDIMPEQKPLIAEEPVPLSKARTEMEKLLTKDELSNREMIKLSRLMEKETTDPGSNRDKREELEIKETTKYIIEEDAAKKTQDFWNDIRPIPLADDEIKSLRSADSLRRKLKPVEPGREITIELQAGKSTVFKRGMQDILFGETWWMDSSRLSFNFGGLANLNNISFNSVDGLNYSLNFRLTKRWKSGRSVSIYPAAGYAFSRESFSWTINSTINYSKTGNNYLWVRAGKNSADFNNNGSANRFLNTAYSLLLKDNLLRLYESEYIGIGHRSELSNGIYLEVSGRMERRNPLTNNTEFSLFSRDRLYDPNVPVHRLLSPDEYPAYMPYSHTHYELKANLSVIPFQRYRMSGGRKIPAGSDYPEFSFSFTQGFNSRQEELLPYSKVSLSATRSKDVGPMAELFWKISSGMIITSDSIPFNDFFHFNTQPSPILLNDYRDAFYLPGWYSMATDRWYVEGHLRYTTPYLLLKYLPGLSNTLIRENLHARYLLTAQTRNYIELGYSLSEVFLLAETGVFVGFENFRFSSAGVRLILRFN